MVTRARGSEVFAGRVILTSVLLLLPAAALAQQSSSGIAGVVRDTSGAVLPGVTVEASSPALIEKVRAVVTDGEGQYKIVDLRVGTYVVTFTLPGFSTLRREGVALTSGFTATVNGVLQVGTLEETVTVTGETPLVDTQNTLQKKTVSSEALELLPSASKGTAMLVAVTPGLSGVADVGGSAGTFQLQNSNSGSAGSNSPFHGKPGSKVMFDGMRINNMDGNGATSGFIVNMLAVEEMTVETGGSSAESTASGIAMNMIPKDGGNTFTGTFAGLFSNDHMQRENLSDALRARGLTAAPKFLLNRDAGGTLGGPIVRDKLWFFTTHRWWAQRNEILGVHNNLTPHSPFYTPDTEPVSSLQPYRSNVVRLTWQASPKNKISGFVANQDGTNPWQQENTSPEAWTFLHYYPQNLYQVIWSSPKTSRLMFEGGASWTIAHYENVPREGVSPDDIGIVETSTGFKYRAAATFAPPSVAMTYNTDQGDRYSQRGSVSYITGSHAVKVGFQNEQGIRSVTARLNGDRFYQFNKGVPSAIVQLAAPNRRDAKMKSDLGIYAQDQWTVKRLTLNYGLRFDYFNAYVPELHLPAGQFVPARDFAPLYGVPLWKDLNPRLGASYDLFGAGKSALKLSLGRYVSVNGVELADANHPVLTSVASVSRVWSDTNGNYIPDCNLTNFALNGECGAISDQNFGKLKITTVTADDVLKGFGHRPYTWDFAAEVQHEILPGASLTGGYYRTWLGNFSITDNQAVAPADYSTYCVTAPVDARLPGGGGFQVCGLYDQSLATFGQVNNLVTQAAHYGTQTQVSNFFNVNLNMRLSSGIRLAGGVDTGQTVTDNCFVVDSPQQLLNCHVLVPWSGTLQLKMNGSYQLPYDFGVSGILQNVPGPQILATYAAPTSQIAPSLGRNLAACGTRAVCTATATVPLIVPGTQYEARRNQLDLRLTKLVKIGSRARLQANVDLYNVLNAASVLSVNNNYGGQWRRPLTILSARLIQVSGQLSF